MTRRRRFAFGLTLLAGCVFPSVCALGLVIIQNGVEIGPVMESSATGPPDCPIGVIDTIAGGAVGDGGAATEATLHTPIGVAFDTNGNLYIADSRGKRVRKVDKAGVITTLAGTDERAYGGEGGRASATSLDHPTSVAVSPDGTIFIAEYGGHRVRRVDAAGTIATVAGDGKFRYRGDGSPATNASFYHPAAVVAVPDGSIYIADSHNNLVRKVDPAGIITTVAGRQPRHRDGPVRSTIGGRVLLMRAQGLGDGGPATEATLSVPRGVALGPDGSLYIADTGQDRIRKLDTAGLITTVAGGGSPSDGLGDGGLATDAKLWNPRSVVVAADGTIYVADTYNHRIRKIDPDGLITTIAGGGSAGASRSGFAGDGGPATKALLRHPEGVTIAPGGDLHIADTLNHRVRKVNAAGLITTVAGGALGDGGPASEASLYNVEGMALGPDGSVYIAEWDDNRVRRIGPDGTITTVAGNGLAEHSGDGGPAHEAGLFHPRGLAVAADGTLYIADYGNDRVRKVDSVGIITTVAGTGDHNWSGDGGPATQAALCGPAGVAVGPDGSLYIGDRENHRVRKIDPLGIITTVAGAGKPGYSGDGGPAKDALLNGPLAVTVGPDGSIYVLDGRNFRIRKVDPAGTITTVAGNGTPGFSGDGGIATQAHLNWYGVYGLAVGPDGSLYIPDQRNHRVRRARYVHFVQTYGGVTISGQPDVPGLGLMCTVAGHGSRNPWGDGGRAVDAGLCYPSAVALAPDGTLYIADSGNHRVRRVRWWPREPGAGKALADDFALEAGESASAWREVAELYMMAKSWEDAVAAAERALELTPNEDEVACLRGELLVARACIGGRDDHGARRRLIRVLARSRDPGLLREAAGILVDLYLLREERGQAIATLNDLRLRTHDPELIQWVDQRLKEIAGD